MDKNAIAKELTDLGQTEAKLMRKLIKVQKRRCAIHQQIAGCAEAGLDDGTIAAARAPKNEPPRG